MSTLQQKIIDTAKAEVGQREGRSGGHWNNDIRYAKEVPGLAWANFQPWCATFVSWVALKSGAAHLYPSTASCDAAGAWYKKQGRWSEYPAIGAQVFFGTRRDLSHTGIVIAYGPDTFTTVEGNTNASGSREGDGVYQKLHTRRDPHVVGYGYPKFPGGITSADPMWASGTGDGPRVPRAPKPAAAVGGRIDVVDLSHHNSNVTAATMRAAADSGVRAVSHKATEGNGFVDTQYGARRRLAAAAGLRFSGYHFARPAASDGTFQAAYFLSVATPAPGDWAPMLDLEDDGGKPKIALDVWVGEFVAEILRVTGVRPVIYNKFELLSDHGCQLWVARYSDAMHPPRIPAPWKDWDLWQFSNGQDGKPDIVPGLGHVDLSTLRSSINLVPHKSTPPPATSKPVPSKPAGAKPAARPPPAKPGTKTDTAKKTLRIGTWNIERDRPPARVLGELAKLVRATDLDVLMLQECNDYREVLTRVPGYRPVAFYQINEQAESMILVRHGLRITDAKAVQVTFDPDGRGAGIAGWYTTKKGGHTPAKHLTIATVEGFTFVSGHTAPSVQNAALRLSHPRQWRSYKEWAARTSGVLSRLGERACIGCDWNVDADVDTGKQPAFPRAMLANARMTRAFPVGGTAGSRTIDGFGIKGGVISGLEVARLDLGSDHRPVTGRLTYTQETS